MGLEVDRGKAHVGTTLRGGKEVGEETRIAADRGAGAGPAALDYTVVPGPETELQDITLGDLDGVGAEGEAESADGDGNGGCRGLEDQIGDDDEFGEHSWGPCKAFPRF